MGRYDVMQVCLNGHVITDRYNSAPEFRKKFCTECSEETITKCQKCEADIPGDYIVDSVAVFDLSEPVAPKICAECGTKFPWHDEIVKAREKWKQEQKEKERRDSLKGATIQVNIDGYGNVVNLGDIIDSTIQNTIKIKEEGNSSVADAINALTEAINEANDIDDSNKKEFLEQLNTLSSQALLPIDERLPKSSLKPIIEFGLGALNSVGSVASIWGTWGDVIKSFFLL